METICVTARSSPVAYAASTNRPMPNVRIDVNKGSRTMTDISKGQSCNSSGLIRRSRWAFSHSTTARLIARDNTALAVLINTSALADFHSSTPYEAVNSPRWSHVARSFGPGRNARRISAICAAAVRAEYSRLELI